MSADGEDSIKMGLGLSSLEDGKQLVELSEDKLNERITKLTLLKHHHGQMIKREREKEKNKLDSLKLRRDANAQEIAFIQEKARRIMFSS